MEAVRRGEAEADQDFPAARVGAEEGGAARVLRFGNGERGGGEDCAAVRDGRGVGVVELEAVDQAAVDHGGVGGACAGRLAEYGGWAAFGDLGGVGVIGGADRRAGRCEADADRVEEVQARGGGDVVRERTVPRAPYCAHQLAGEGHGFTIAASVSFHPWERRALSPRMMFERVEGAAGKMPPAFSASLERSVGSSKGLS